MTPNAFAARQRERQRQGGGERHGTAHAGEAQHECHPPGWRRIPFTQSLAEDAGQVDRGIDPGKAGDDDDGDNERGREHDLLQRERLGLFVQQSHLRSRDQEQHALDQEDHQVPEEDALQAGCGGDQERAVPTDVEAAGHGGEDAGAAEMLGNPVGKVGRDQ